MGFLIFIGAEADAANATAHEIDVEGDQQSQRMVEDFQV